MKVAAPQTRPPVPTITKGGTFSLESPYQLLQKIPEIYREIEKTGFVVLRAWDNSEKTLLKVAQYFGRIQGHAKADERGLVTVTPERATNSPKEFDRNLSKTSQEFLLHTDGSFMNGICPVEEKYFRLGPPGLFLLQCVRPASVGGESVLLDAEAVLNALVNEQPELARIAQMPGLLHFFGGDQVALDFPLFERLAVDRYRIRFRLDLALAKSENAASIRFLIDKFFLSPRFQTRRHLESNEIIVVDNSRIVHGRDGISLEGTEGARLLRRAWIWDEHNAEVEALSNSLSGLQAFERARVYGPKTDADLRLRPLSLGIRLSRQAESR